jgi:hypothetical protein
MIWEGLRVIMREKVEIVDLVKRNVIYFVRTLGTLHFGAKTRSDTPAPVTCSK